MLEPSQKRCLTQKDAKSKLAGFGSILQASGEPESWSVSLELTPRSVSSLYVYSISVALQALTVISIGGVADYRTQISHCTVELHSGLSLIAPHRKKLLLFFAALGSISTVLFLILPSESSIWVMSALLAVLANVSFGASVVAMNSYLPSLAKESPQVREAYRVLVISSQEQHGESRRHSSLDFDHESLQTPLISQYDPTSDTTASSMPSSSRARYHDTLSRVTSRISSLGIAMGYAAGIFLLTVVLVPVEKLRGSTFSLRLAIGVSGIWWAIFSLPAAIWLPVADETEVNCEQGEEEGINDGWDGTRISRSENREWKLSGEIRAAWVRLGTMLTWSEVLKLKNTFKYLAAWFLLSDGKSCQIHLTYGLCP